MTPKADGRGFCRRHVAWIAPEFCRIYRRPRAKGACITKHNGKCQNCPGLELPRAARKGA